MERVAERSGVHLHGDLGVGVDPEAVVERGEDAREEVGGHEGGVPPPKKTVRSAGGAPATSRGGAARGGREGGALDLATQLVDVALHPRRTASPSTLSPTTETAKSQ